MFGRLFAMLRAEKIGRTDGRKRIPGWDAPELAPFVDEQQHAASKTVEAFRAGFDREDETPYAKFQDTREERDEWQKRAGRAEKAYDAALDHFEQENDYRPAVVKPASAFWHIISMAFLFIIEVPLSYAAFSPFGLPAYMQLILAVGVGLIFAFMGHRLGALLKEGAFRTVHNTTWIIFVSRYRFSQCWELRICAKRMQPL